MSGGKEGEISVDVGVPAGSWNISIGRRRVRSVSQPVRGVLTPRVELDQDVDQVGGQQSEVAGGSRDDVPLTARTSNLRVVSQPEVVTRSGQVRSDQNTILRVICSVFTNSIKLLFLCPLSIKVKGLMSWTIEVSKFFWCVWVVWCVV